DADEVEWVEGGDLELLVLGGVATEGDEGLEGLGQGELLALEASDEAAAADLAAGLEPAIDVEQGAPRRGGGLAGQQRAGDDAIAAQVEARELDGAAVAEGPRRGCVIVNTITIG